MTEPIYFILGAILIGIFICGCCAAESDQAAATEDKKADQDLERRKKADLEKRKKAWLELCYDDRKKEYEFWTYFGKRKRGKLLYIVPEFEQRIVKMNKLKKGRD